MRSSRKFWDAVSGEQGQFRAAGLFSEIGFGFFSLCLSFSQGKKPFEPQQTSRPINTTGIQCARPSNPLSENHSKTRRNKAACQRRTYEINTIYIPFVSCGKESGSWNGLKLWQNEIVEVAREVPTLSRDSQLLWFPLWESGDVFKKRILLNLNPRGRGKSFRGSKIAQAASVGSRRMYARICLNDSSQQTRN